MGGIFIIGRDQQRAARQIHIKFHRIILAGEILYFVIDHAGRPSVCLPEGDCIVCFIIGCKPGSRLGRIDICPVRRGDVFKRKVTDRAGTQP